MEEIVNLKSKANQSHRWYQRMQDIGEVRLKADEYQQARRKLKAAIRESKRRRKMELCSQVEEEPYGRPYKIVMKKVGVLP